MVIVDVAPATAPTVKRMLFAVVATQPVTTPVVSVAPGAGALTLTMLATGVVLPVAKVKVGATWALAAPVTVTLKVRTAVA